MFLNKVFSFALVILLFYSVPSLAQDNKEEAKKLLDKFLTAWLVEQDIDKTIAYIDKDMFLDIARRELNPSVDAEFWLRKTLVMWLEEDHGQINEWGHGNPIYPGYKNLLAKPSDLKNRLEPMATLPEVEMDETDLRNQIAGSDAEVAYLASFKFNHAPRDLIIIVLLKTSKGWKIMAPIWIVA